MLVYMCDNKKCARTFDSTEDMVHINIGETKKYMLCKDCANDIINIVSRLTQTKDEDITEENREEYKKVGKIQEYGKERLIEEYISGKYTAAELDRRLGLSKGAVGKFLRKNGIKRDNSMSNDAEKEGH